MPSETALYRLTPSVAEILERLAKGRKLTASMVLEMLVLNEAKRLKLIEDEHPESAYWHLIDMINAWEIPVDEDYTLKIFLKIQNNAEARQYYSTAILPAQGKREDKRKQSVNQRLGRFCGQKSGWESDIEIVLEQGTCSLIQSYTRLKPPRDCS